MYALGADQPLDSGYDKPQATVGGRCSVADLIVTLGSASSILSCSARHCPVRIDAFLVD
jgi:hypothetical protein